MRWDLVLVLRQLGGRVNATVGKRGCPRSGVGRVGVQGLRGGGERGWGRGKTNRHRSTVLPVASSPNSSVATCCARGSCTPRGVGAGAGHRAARAVGRCTGMDPALVTDRLRDRFPVLAPILLVF